MVYFICGHRGCGKSFLANQLKDNTNCNLYDTGPIVRNCYKQTNRGLSFDEWLSLGIEMYGNDFTNQIICSNINLNSEKDTIIIGNRGLEGILYIINYFNIENYKIYFIDGDFNLFRENYNYREGLNLSIEEFNEVIEKENSMGIRHIENFVIENPDKGKYFYKNKNDDSILESIVNDIKAKNKVLKIGRRK